MVTKISDFLNTTFSTLSLNDAVNNSVVYPGTIVHTTTSTPGTGIGAGLQFQVETSNNNNEYGMSLETLTTDVTVGSEDFDFIVKLMQNGAAAGERLRLNSAGQLTVLSGLVATSLLTSNGGMVETSGVNNGLRLTSPGGGSYVGSPASVTGAIKIKLPTSAYSSSTMLQMTVKIYEYAGSASGTSRAINLGGYNYVDNNWYNFFATQQTMGGGDINVRFGHDGTSNCIWIGDTSTVWSYPQIFVTDFQAGHSNFTPTQWRSGWTISIVTVLDTVTAGPIICAKNLTSTGGWSVTGTIATTGTATVNALVSNGAVSGTTGAFSGALTLTSAAPQINLNNGTSNWISWNTNGVAAPTFTTRSAGTKLVLYPNIGAANTDYALGIEGSTMWFTVDTTSAQYKWYGGTTQAMLLSGAGALSTTSTTTSTAFIPSGSSVPTNGMYLPTTNTVGFATNSVERMRINQSGQVGIGTTSPDSQLSIRGGTAMTSGWNRVVSLNATYPSIVFNSNNSKYSGIGVDFSVVGAGLVFWTNGSSADISGTGTVAARISHLGNMSLGDNAAEPPSKLVVISSSGAAPVNTTGSGAVRLRSTATAGVGIGPSLIFEGQTNNTTANYGFAAIQGFKSSATAADYSGSLAFYTQSAGGATALDERMRIDGNGSVGIATTTPGSVLDVNGIASFRSAISVASGVQAATLASNGAISGTTITGTSATVTSLQNSGTTTTNALVSNVYGLFGQNVTVNSSNASTSTTTGALVLGGGAGIAGRLNIGGAAWFASTLNAGGAFIAQSINSNTNVVATNVQSTGQASVSSLVSNGAVSGTTGTFTGALYGASFNTAGTATVNALVSNGAISGTTITGTGATVTSLQNSGIETVNGLVSNVFGRFGQNVSVASTNVSISTTTGALIVSGGTGIAGNVWAGGNVVLGGGAAVNQFWGNNNDTAAQPSFAWSSNTSSGMFLPNTSTVAFSTAGTERMRIDATGNVGIGTSTIQTGYKLQVEGDFAATSKSFVINHPTKPGMMLRYGSLESPYHGIRLTGEGEVIDGKCTIQLPEYTHALCKHEGAQVQLTNIKHGKTLWIDEIDIDHNQFTVKTRGKGKYRFYWSFTAIRKDIEDMLVEFNKE